MMYTEGSLKKGEEKKKNLCPRQEWNLPKFKTLPLRQLVGRCNAENLKIIWHSTRRMRIV